MAVCKPRSVTISRRSDTIASWRRLKAAFLAAFEAKRVERWSQRAAIRAEIAELAQRQNIALETDDSDALAPLTKLDLTVWHVVMMIYVSYTCLHPLASPGKATLPFTRLPTYAGVNGCAAIHCCLNPSENNGSYCPVRILITVSWPHVAV
jgi:hypothetical protein